MRWGSLLVFALLLAPLATQAQEAPPPLKLRLSGSDFRTPPLQLAPGASWETPALAPNPRPALTVGWRGSNQDWDISAVVSLIEEARFNASDFQTGGLFATEAVVMRRFGDFKIGAAGYTARRAGEDVGRGPELGQSRWRGSAAGPVIGYDAKVIGQPATLSLRWYREIGAPGENGDTVSAAMALKF